MSYREIWTDDLLYTKLDDHPWMVRENPFWHGHQPVIERNTDMPFISNEAKRRDEFEGAGLASLCRDIRDRMTSEDDDFTPADLAFIVYKLLQASAKGCRFERRNAMMGAVDEARLTWRRLVHDPKEDTARADYGDIE